MGRSLRKPSRKRRACLEQCEPRRVWAGESLVGPVYGPLPPVLLEQPLPSVESSAASSAVNVPFTNGVALAGQGQTVAVIDTGVAYDHEALGGGIGPGFPVLGGWDFAENDADPYDDGPAGFHGTHVAGIVASRDPAQLGVAPGANLVALRVFDDAGATRPEWVENALRWVLDHRQSFATPITAVNLSLGTWQASAPATDLHRFDDELAALRAAGVLVTVSAGNEFSSRGTTGLSYPASQPDVIPVASLDAQGHLSAFSQRDSRVLAAPGEHIVSTVPDYVLGADGRVDDFAAASGTSMAAPQVAAAGVLVRAALEARGETPVTVDEIEHILRTTATPVWDPITSTTYPRIDVAAAIRAATSESVTTQVSTTHLESATDWGRIDQRVLDSSAFPTNERWFRFTASHSALLTNVATFSASSPSNASLPGAAFTLHDATGRQIAAGQRTAQNLRLDAEVQEGATYYLRWSGGPSPDVVRVQNLVQVGDGRVEVFGSPADNTVRVETALPVKLVVGGIAYERLVPSGKPTQIHLDVTQSRDRVELVGTSGADRLVSWPDRARWNSGPVSVLMAGIAELVVEGGGGFDTAIVQGGPRDEQFLLGSTQSSWTDGVAKRQLNGFEYVTVAPGPGGRDTIDFANEPAARRETTRGTTRLTRFLGGTAYALPGPRRPATSVEAAASEAAAPGDSATSTVSTSGTSASGTSVTSTVSSASQGSSSGSTTVASASSSQQSDADTVRAIDYLFKKLGRK